MKETENKGGRPTDYNSNVVVQLCEQLAQGISLRTVCLAPEMPALSTVFKWLAKYPEFVEQYDKAKIESTEAMSEDTLFLADQSSEVLVGDKSDNARVQAMKLRVDTRKWLMSKMKPKKYGEKLDMTTNGKDLPTPIYSGNSLKTGNDM